MAYITKADVAAYLNLTLTPSGEAIVDAAIPAVEASAEAYCNRRWNVTTPQTEVFDGDSPLLNVSCPPIQSVTSVVVSGTILTTQDYAVYDTYIRLLSSPYTAYYGSSISGYPYRNIVVTYTPNAPLPADVKQALIQWTAEMFKASEDAGKLTRSVTVGSVKVDYLAQDGMPKYVELTLNRYRLQPV